MTAITTHINAPVTTTTTTHTARRPHRAKPDVHSKNTPTTYYSTTMHHNLRKGSDTSSRAGTYKTLPESHPHQAPEWDTTHLPGRRENAYITSKFSPRWSPQESERRFSVLSGTGGTPTEDGNSAIAPPTDAFFNAAPPQKTLLNTTADVHRYSLRSTISSTCHLQSSPIYTHSCFATRTFTPRKTSLRSHC